MFIMQDAYFIVLSASRHYRSHLTGADFQQYESSRVFEVLRDHVRGALALAGCEINRSVIALSKHLFA